MKITRLKHNQEGMVAIIVTLVTMLVLVLIVVSFAQIARREQRNALDHQLSTQAYYAAESGINVAKEALKDNYKGTANDGNKTDCDPDASGRLSGSNIINNSLNVAYTCLLITQQPQSLPYSIDVNSAVSADMQFKDSSGTVQKADFVIIRWKAANGAPSTYVPLARFPNFPNAASWGANTALLRVAATDLSGANPYDRDNLNSNTFTSFFYPVAGGSAPLDYIKLFTPQTSAANLKDQGQIVKANCVPAGCIAALAFTTPVSHIFLRIGALYAASDITITASKTTGGSIPQLNIFGAQAVIDVTGKAQDVLRRVQVHVPINPPSSSPDFTIQSVDGICKQLSVYSGVGIDGPPACP